jgi:hypothetical protein
LSGRITCYGRVLQSAACVGLLCRATEEMSITTFVLNPSE